MRYLKIIFLIAISSTIFTMPAGTTVIGFWGSYSNGIIDKDNYCNKCSELKLEPKINYFLIDNLSLDFDINIYKDIRENEDENDFDLELDIGASYFYKNLYLKGSVIIDTDLESNKEDPDMVLRGGVGYLMPISKNVFFDISYNLISDAHVGVFKLLKYSFKVSL